MASTGRFLEHRRTVSAGQKWISPLACALTPRSSKAPSALRLGAPPGAFGSSSPSGARPLAFGASCATFPAYPRTPLSICSVLIAQPTSKSSATATSARPSLGRPTAALRAAWALGARPLPSSPCARTLMRIDGKAKSLIEKADQDSVEGLDQATRPRTDKGLVNARFEPRRIQPRSHRHLINWPRVSKSPTFTSFSTP